MSPVSSNNRFYADPERLDVACIAPAVYSATPTLAAFNTEGAHEIIADLRLHAFLTTALTGANNDLRFIARTPGTGGLAITVAIAVAGNNTALSIAVTGTDIVINSATDGSGTATSTASQVLAALLASPDALALVIPSLAPSNTGVGAVVALAATNLGDVSGTSPTLDVKCSSSVDATNYTDHASYTQKTAVGATQTKMHAPTGLTAKWTATLAGTTPVFCFSIEARARR